MAVLAHHQIVIDRFVAVCQSDERVLAAFLGGSYARGEADAYSDLDLYLITTDEAHADFITEREAFVRQLGEPVFLERFNRPDIVFFILADGIEGELGIGAASQFTHIHTGPYHVLLDKRGLLIGMVFPPSVSARADQVETLRRLIDWFWHDLSHFITAVGRGQLWWAYGQLEMLRRYGVNLARLQHNIADPDVGDEVYFKVERTLPVATLAPLQATFCPQEVDAMLHAAHVIVQYYQALARSLAQTYGLAYPSQLERVMVDRLARLSQGV